MTRRRMDPRPRRVIYAAALQKLSHAQVPNREEARELRRNRLPDGSYPLVALVRPEPAR